MATKLPYVVQPGSMIKILEKIRSAKTPDRFTHDFLSTKLGFTGGSCRPFIPLAKKLGLLASDGSPTELYKQFRNPDSTKAAMAKALRTAYREAFERNEYANQLESAKFKGLVVEITGLASDNQVVQLTCRTFEALRALADFESELPSNEQQRDAPETGSGDVADENGQTDRNVDFGLSYTINLVLPKTDDPAVFNAIFKSLRDNLLRK